MKNKTKSGLITSLLLFVMFVLPNFVQGQEGNPNGEILFGRINCNSWNLFLNDANIKVIFPVSHPINADGSNAWFEVWRSHDLGPRVSLGTYQGKDTIFTDSKLFSGNYTYRIDYNGNGPAPLATEFIFFNQSSPDIYTCSTITVNETPVTGGTWSITGGLTANSNQIPTSSGVQYCLTSTSVPNSYTLLRIDNSVTGQNSSCFTTQYDTTSYSFTINYQANPPPPPPPLAQPNPPVITTTPGACGTGTINLTWSSSTATSYQIFRNGSPIYSGSGTSYSDTGLTANQTYNYTGTATNSDGTSALSVSYPGTAPNVCPSVTVDLKGRQASTGSYGDGPLSVASGSNIDLQWTPANATSCTASNGWSGAKTFSNGTYNQLSLGPISSNTTFTISCAGTGGPAVDSFVVNVTAPPVTVDLKGRQASTGSYGDGPLSVASGSNIDLQWTPANATSCTASNGWSGAKTFSNGTYNQLSLGPISSNTTFTISCAGTGGPAVDSFVVNVTAPSPTADIQGRQSGTVSYSNGPVSMPIGSSADISWTSTNATRCLATGGEWTGTYGSSGSISGFGPYGSAGTRNFGISCDTGPSTTAGTDNVTFNVTSGATINVSSNVSTTWTITGGINGSGTSGSHSVSPASGGSPYTITPATPGGYTLTSVTNSKTGSGSSMTLVPGDTASFTLTYTAISAPIVNISASPTSVASGGSSTLTWSSTNATGCTASASPANGQWVGAKSVGNPTSANQTITNITATTQFTLTCTGLGGTTPASATVTMTGLSFNYNLSNSGNSSVTKSASPVNLINTITKTLTQGTTQSVDVTATGMPANVSVVYANKTCSPTCNTTLTFTVQPTAVAGTYPITVTGTSAGLVDKTTNFNLIISDPVFPTVSLTVSPSKAGVGQQVTWTPVLSGGTGCSYSWSGTEIPSIPAPTGSTFSISYQTTGVKTTNLTVTCNEGVVSAQGTIVIALNPIFEEF